MLDLRAQGLALLLQSVLVTFALKLLVRVLHDVLQLVSFLGEHALDEFLPESPLFVVALLAHVLHSLRIVRVYGLILLKRQIHDVEHALP